jgi:hypothetical protein
MRRWTVRYNRSGVASSSTQSLVRNNQNANPA